MKPHLKLPGLLAIVVSLLALPACSAFETDSSKDMSLEEVRNQQEAWGERGIEDYVFSYGRRTEDAPDQVGPFLVYVTGGAVDSVYANGQRFEPREGQTIFTVDGVYAFIIDALQDDPDVVSFDFLPTFNIPIYSGIDYDSNDFGDEEIIELVTIENEEGESVYLIDQTEGSEASGQAAR